MPLLPSPPTPTQATPASLLVLGHTKHFPPLAFVLTVISLWKVFLQKHPCPSLIPSKALLNCHLLKVPSTLTTALKVISASPLCPLYFSLQPDHQRPHYRLTPFSVLLLPQECRSKSRDCLVPLYLKHPEQSGT